MSSSADARAVHLDGLPADDLARRLALPRVELFARVGSTLDVAQARAADLPSGTLILADEQTAGRGRQGRAWSSAPGAGIWLTLVERPADPRALDVLALRCGLQAAEALEPLAAAPVCLKWPNDLYVAGRKLAGILIETRWRGAALDWVAIGFGLNVRAPAVDTGTGLAPGTARLDALDRLVPALRRAAAVSGHLCADELARWRRRDVAGGRVAASPAAGIVEGIESDGRLLITSPDGILSRHRSGSLTFADPSPLTCS